MSAVVPLGGSGEPDARAYRALQRELVETRNRFDRQVAQLKRLNSVAPALQQVDERPTAEVFAEAVLDVLDIGFGAVWILPSQAVITGPRFACLGWAVDEERWAMAGQALDALLHTTASNRAQRITTSLADLLPGVELHDVMAGRCIGRDGAALAVVLSANTPITTGADDAPGADALEILSLLAEKCADHLDASRDWHLIRDQMDQLRESQERLELVLRGTNDGWWDWDLVTGSCIQSARWHAMLGEPYPQSTVTDSFWLDEVHPEDRPGFEALLTATLREGAATVETEVRLRERHGGHLPVLVRGIISHDVAGAPVRFAGSILDLSERKQHEQFVHQLAFYDALTDLPNRRLLLDRLQQALLAADRAHRTTAVLMIDLDRFKSLNDTHGHAAGDELLRAVAQRLRDSVRSEDTVARLGGDEFVVLLSNLDEDHERSQELAEAIGTKILHALAEPYLLSVGVTHHSASVGVAVAHSSSTTPDTALKQADVAMYEAKSAGRNLVRLFRPEMQSRVDHRSEMETRLRAAVERNQLNLMYQVQVDADGSLYGAEALMRWHPDDGEPVPPTIFIPIAEDSGLIREIGPQAFQQACRQAVAWRPFAPEGFRIAVNVSASEFMIADYVAQVVEILASTGALGSEVRLEITEANVVSDLQAAADRMNALRNHGIVFSLDDFGTGYSSLTYLRQLPVDEVKIDRSYVRRFLNDRHDEAILKAILNLCTELDIKVVAEGVETEEQWNRLVADGCTYFQGYLFGRALPPGTSPADLTSESMVALPR